MTQRLREPAVLAWLALMAATTLSWWLGEGHGPVRVASVGVISLAFAKVYVVGQHFMELKDAPLALRLLFGGWCAAVCTLLVAMYLFGA